MAKSKITITFTTDSFLEDEVIGFTTYSLTSPGNEKVLLMTWKDLFFRTAKQTIPIQEISVTGITGQGAAAVFAKWFSNDNNAGGKTLVGLPVGDANIVITQNPTLTGDICDIGYKDFVSTSSKATALVENCIPSTLGLTDVTFSENVASNCAFYEADVTTSELATKITLNGNLITDTNVANPFTQILTRGIDNNLVLENAGGDILTLPTYRLDTWGTEDVNVTVANSLSGSTITLTPDVISQDPNISFEYSLDDTVWQSSNIFTGQTEGTKTVYIRDNFGCKKNLDVVVDAFGTREPFLFFSGANSVTFKESVVVDNCSIFRNESNALEFQGLEQIKYCDNILFQTCDTTKLQFKSNFSTPTAFVRHEDGTADTAITVSKMSSNLNRFKSMDCMYYDYANGLMGIYFESGNTYDEFGLPIDTYSLNGNLPEFAIKGEQIELEGLGIATIVDIVFDSTIGKKAIIIEYIVFSPTPVAAIITSVYDVLPYEIYEIEIDWSAQGVGVHDIYVKNEDTQNTTVEHLSENILVDAEQENCLAIRYYNDNNRDIFYKYGIQHFIRVPYLHVEGLPLDESELNINDLTSNITESSVHELNKFTFEECTKSMMRKLVIALSCDTVFINGQGYIKQNNIEVENTVNTNQYLVIATMLKTNINYNNNRQGQLGLDDGTLDFDIPPFIWGDNGFVNS